jgi:hypothetical protein
MRAVSRMVLCLWLAATLASLSPRSAETVELRHGDVTARGHVVVVAVLLRPSSGLTGP